MQILKEGSAGAPVALLQTALRRWGYPLAADGIFGPVTARAVRKFQQSRPLAVDGVVGANTWAALRTWLTGYAEYTVRPGDSLWKIARRYETSLALLESANPRLDPFALQPGTVLTVPLAFPVVPTDIPWCSAAVEYCLEGLRRRYPAVTAVSVIGKSVLGRDIRALTVGEGERRVLYSAEHHANEWITVPLLLHFAEELLSAFVRGETVFGIPAEDILRIARITLVPAVNPDGLDLVTGALPAREADAARAIAAGYPAIPFPSGWKANIRGVDLNLQYPAGWENAREIKFAQGYTGPAPRDYVGASPLSAPESAALAAFTRREDPALILAYHSQGQVIYWRYLDREPPGSRALAEKLAAVSGYTYEETPAASGYAGYKDWFIDAFDRPGYTVEVGRGDNPLPLTQFDEIYAANRGILVLAASGE